MAGTFGDTSTYRCWVAEGYYANLALTGLFLGLGLLILRFICTKYVFSIYLGIKLFLFVRQCTSVFIYIVSPYEALFDHHAPDV